MKLMQSPFVALLVALTVITTVHAAKDFPDAPLLPGTKVIAGDLAKDEFFIVADNDVMKVKKPMVEELGKEPVKVKPSIQVAINKSKSEKLMAANKRQIGKMPIGAPQSQLNQTPALIDIALKDAVMVKPKPKAQEEVKEMQHGLFTSLALNKAITARSPIAKPKSAEKITVPDAKETLHAVRKNQMIEGAGAPIQIASMRRPAEKITVPGAKETLHAARKNSLTESTRAPIQMASLRRPAEKITVPGAKETLHAARKNSMIETARVPVQLASIRRPAEKITVPGAKETLHAARKNPMTESARAPIQIASLRRPAEKITVPGAKETLHAARKNPVTESAKAPVQIANLRQKAHKMQLAGHVARRAERLPLAILPPDRRPATLPIQVKQILPIRIAKQEVKAKKAPMQIQVALKKAVTNETHRPANLTPDFKKAVAQNKPMLTDFEFDDVPFPKDEMKNAIEPPPQMKHAKVAAKQNNKAKEMKPVLMKQALSNHHNLKPVKLSPTKPMTLAIKDGLSKPVQNKKTAMKFKNALAQANVKAIQKKAEIKVKSEKQVALKKVVKAKSFVPKIIAFKPARTYAKKPIKNEKKQSASIDSRMKIHQFVSDKPRKKTNVALR